MTGVQKKCPHRPGAQGRWGLGAPGGAMKSIIKDPTQLLFYHKWIKNVKNS
jgi:hypothetical protein